MIKLTRFKHATVKVLPEVILNYIDIILHTAPSDQTRYQFENLQIECSVLQQLHDVLQKKVTARYPNKTYSLSLEIHQAIVLQRALLWYVETTDNDFKTNKAEIIKNDLNNKITNQIPVSNEY